MLRSCSRIVTIPEGVGKRFVAMRHGGHFTFTRAMLVRIGYPVANTDLHNALGSAIYMCQQQSRS